MSTSARFADVYQNHLRFRIEDEDQIYKNEVTTFTKNLNQGTRREIKTDVCHSCVDQQIVDVLDDQLMYLLPHN